MALVQKTFLRFGSITGIAADGAKKVIEFADDANLFEVLCENGCMSSEGTCAGNVACGKCLVKVVSGKVPEAEDEEKEILEDKPAGSRLACAIILDGSCDGAVFQTL